jgi:hypothetical protein
LQRRTTPGIMFLLLSAYILADFVYNPDWCCDSCAGMYAAFFRMFEKIMNALLSQADFEIGSGFRE